MGSASRAPLIDKGSRLRLRPCAEARTSEGRVRLSPLFRYAGLYAVSATLLRLVGFAVFVWLARSLSVNEYATWGLLYALQTAAASFGLVGIVEAVIGLLRGGK